jgi:hypothetical protein
MPTLGNTPRPAYVYDTETDTWVPVGVGAHTHSDIPNTLVDAKGDLITATADNVPARLAKGADGTVLVADSTTSTGLAWQPYKAQVVAGKNAVINGGFDIWQRGISSTTIGSYATADRWAQGTFSGTGTFAQDASNIAPNNQFSMRFTASATSQPYLVSVIETQNALTYAGQQVTLSAYLATSTSANVQLSIQFTTSTDSAWNAIYTGLTPTSGTDTVTTTTTLARKSVTYNIPSNARTLRVIIVSSATMATSSTLTVGAVQLELGPVATPFSRAGGTIQGELAACQRYYESQIGNMGFVGSVGNGIAYYAFGRFQVQKRTGSSNIGITTTGVSGFPASNAIAEQINVSGFRTYLVSNAATNNGFYINNWTADCEL